jgi:hypothetical protein
MDRERRNQLRRDRRQHAPLDEPGPLGGRSVRQTKLDQENRRHVKKYGISIEDRLRMTLEQGGRCLICGCVLEPAGHRKRIIVDLVGCVDHDHETGEVRGILCYACNAGLGHFKDDPRLMALAIQYVERSKRG